MDVVEKSLIRFVEKIQDWEDGFLFDRGILPTKSSKLKSEQLVVYGGKRPYGESVLLDMVLFFAERPVYQCLGLSVLSYLLSGEKDDLEIFLDNKNSQIKLLKVVNPLNNNHDLSEISLSLNSYRYIPERISKDIFWQERDDRFLPKIVLSDDKKRGIMGSDDFRDIAVMHCDLFGLINFMKLLIDFGQPSNDVCELSLEAYPGNKAVAKTSAEMILNLPGSDWWTFD